MDGMEYVKSGDEPYMQMDRLKLRNYFPHEIEKLSVLRVNKTTTFDEIGYPIKGGLYDPLMGPLEGRDRCETCNQYEIHCPGHIGHIELDVPVFNPVLFSFTLNLLKGSCVHCHRFTCNVDGMASRLVQAQLRCFELGVPYLAADLEQAFKEKLGDHLNVAPVTLDEEAELMGELDKMIAQMTEAPLSLKNANMPTKNAVDMRRDTIRKYCKDFLFKRRERCPLCKARNGKITNDGGRAVIINFSGMKSKGKKQSALNADEYEVEESSDEDEKEEKKNDLENIGYGGIEVTEGSLDQQMVNVQLGKCDKLAWRGAEIREHFRLLYKNDGRILLKLFPMLTDKMAGEFCPLDGLFCEHVIVPPTKFRPIRMFKGQKYEDPQTVNLRRLLEGSELIKAIALIIKGEKDHRIHELVAQRGIGRTINAKMHNAYLNLQQRMNAIFDEDLDKRSDGLGTPGIKQILEKKQGLFRMNMMGKRVNFACRSVITPDPYLDIDEIGIPEIFAKKLTFPEPVHMYNVQDMRNLVKKGPKVHPGANYVVQANKKRQILSDLYPEDKKTRRQLAESLQLGGHGNMLRGPMKVLRHLKKGDMMMMNRQPSLHKPSIMGHRARILTGQRALRMNYAPCKAYNADFDGDEMNGHLVQTTIAQCEVSEIASVGSNLLVPKDATPLLGLIQDHVVSGVLLTLRGRFLNKEDFMHLVLAAFSETPDRLEIPAPCMIKPAVLYSGKQVVSTIIKNCIPKGQPLINLTGKAKTPLSCWKVCGFKTPEFNMSESEVVFRQGELLVGVLDKAHYGATQFGLAHCCFELYGSKVGVKILSCFSRLFTTYLQFHGFTLGVADILVRKDADSERKKAVLESRTIGEQVVKSSFGLSDDATSKEIKHVLASTYCNPRGQGTDVKMLDYGMKQGVAKYNDAIVKACVPEGLIRSFPENALQMMIQSGAKGSSVNAIQISCNLGQIELEGKRMATTIAGRTLPSFKAFDPSPRAGGYIDQRFLTGINPQELFFHTMAGREGLIDTAVKTSRSGYLQRCIIKHLEGIKVHYDSTVRDHDGSVVQFRYGEDGLDTCKATFLGPKTFKFLEENIEMVTKGSRPENIYDSDFNADKAEKQFSKIKKWAKKNKDVSKKQYASGFTVFANDHTGLSKGKLVAMWFELSPEEKFEYEKKVPKKCPTSVDEKFNGTTTLGALPEKVLNEIDKFVHTKDDEDVIRRSLFWKGMRCLADPGENVGLLAAQSIGEPSTQMTLNTFHFAGRGEMNVTLGIPRLREILMTASKNIATPSAQIAVIPGTPKEKIDKIKQQLDRVYMKQVLRKFSLEDRANMNEKDIWRRYTLRLEVLDSSKREQGAKYLKRSRIMREIEFRFIRNVADAIQKKLHVVADYQQMQSRKLRAGNLAAGLGDETGGGNRRGPTDDGASSDEEADGGHDADAAEKKLHNRHNDEAADYEGEDEDRGAVEPNEPEEKENENDQDQMDTEENPEEKDNALKKDAPRKASPDDRIRNVISISNIISGYKFDTSSDKWCEVTFQLPLTAKTKLDIATLVEQEVEKFIVHQTPGIERCVESVQNKDGVEVTYIQTQGVNLQALFAHANCLDVNSVYSNDLNLVLNQYGVEACARAIVSEMNNVFAVYGIDVSKRHLSLTADYMTFTGAIAPFNRVAMASAASPLQKMTFETTIAFLRDSLLNGEDDVLNSPSSRLVVGGLNRGGTGAFDLLFNTEMEPPVQFSEKNRRRKF